MTWNIAYALEFAYKAHERQFRSDANRTPYIVHPIRVYDILRRFTDDLELLTAALLHDTVEDTNVTVEDLENCFNATVASFVKDLSNPPDVKGKENKHKEKLERFKNFSFEAGVIKLADMISNVEDARSRVCHEKWDNRKKIDYINRCGEYAELIIKYHPGIEYDLQKLWFAEYERALAFTHQLQYGFRLREFAIEQELSENQK